MASIPQPPPPSRKSNTLLWVLLGVGGFFLLMVLVVGGGIAYIALHPELAMRKLITAANPNIEVLSLDKKTQLLKLRDKRTGQTYNISFDDAKNGRFTLKDDNGGGTVTIGGGDARVPAWVPDYPGSSPQAAFSAQGNDGDSGTFTFKTGDSAEKVTKFYLDQFQSTGLGVTTNVMHHEAQSSGGMLVGEDSAKRHSVTVIISREGAYTTVAVTYVTKK